MVTTGSPPRRPGAAPPASDTHEADGLIRGLESQLRRALLGERGADLVTAAQTWAGRMSALRPDLAAEARDIAASLPEVNRLTGRPRSDRIAQALGRLAALRSSAAGHAASGRPPAAPPAGAVNSSVAGAKKASSTGAAAPRPAAERAASSGSGRPTPAAAKPLRSSPPAATPLPSSRQVAPKQPATTSAGKPAQAARRRRKAAPQVSDLTLASPIELLPGYTRKYAAALDKLNLHVIADLLRHYPRRYLDYSKLLPIAELRPGEEVTVEARVLRCEGVGLYGKRSRRVEATLTDSTGTIRAVWFGQEWRIRQLQPASHLYVSGKVEAFNGRLQFSHPDYEPVSDKESIHTGRLVPVYRLSGELPGNWLRAKTKLAVDELAHRVPDPLPDTLRERWKLPPLHAALQQMHFPDDEEELAAARRRIAFDHLLVLQLALLQRKRRWQSRNAVPLSLSEGRLAAFVRTLPFALTDGQRRALDEILADIAQTRPMKRLLEGDVGSGKTVVAALAMLAAVEHGCQAILLAPTEVLAEQHARTLARLFTDLAPTLQPVLVTGSLAAGERTAIRRQLADGQAGVFVGTHALITERSRFSRLALLIVDEEHRFGVEQEAAFLPRPSPPTSPAPAQLRLGSGQDEVLAPEDACPHLLAMTATPIPRTLGLNSGEIEIKVNRLMTATPIPQTLRLGRVFKDWDLSVIDQKPAGRPDVKTRYALSEKRDAVYSFLRAQVQQGRQAYIICPLVEESEVMATKAVTTEYERLKSYVFPDLSLDLLHGRMKSAQKEDAMRRFRDGETQVLVATTVIEVGVDVPNASVILIEGADRFGLAQLHQLRGRVGRAEHQSYCILMASEEINEQTEERLQKVEATSDGFALAAADLRLRRQGKLFDVKQSGEDPLLQWAAFADLDEARRAAEELLDRDAELADPAHAVLAKRAANPYARDSFTTQDDAKPQMKARPVSHL